MGVEIFATHTNDTLRGDGSTTTNGPGRIGGPRRRKGTYPRLTIVRVNDADGTASDFVDIRTLGLRGLISAAWRGDGTADEATVAPNFPTAGIITFTASAAADCDGFLWILSAS